MKKIILIFSAILVSAGFTFAQHNYCSFDGKSQVGYGHRDGKLDSLSANPKSGNVYKGTHCIQYKRSANKFDNLKIHPQGKVEDVSGFATFHKDAQKMKVKIYSTAPVGTLIELQFTKKGIDSYPKGVHSQFQAKTKKQNEWEELEFNFVSAPEGSEVKAYEIDEFVILFAPNTSGTNTFYFTDLIGPKMSETPEAIKTNN
ncbi:MAG: hypothetical protein H0X62_10795 [Bacteroidetes bacterium]|nr:hypothetical protein [Bacteroidota bacterium]